MFNRATRKPRRRAEAVAALAMLARRDEATAAISNPVFLAERGDLEDAIADGVCLPGALGRPLHTELTRRLDEVSPRGSAGPTAEALADPQPVTPGSLGAWTEEAG